MKFNKVDIIGSLCVFGIVVGTLWMVSESNKTTCKNFYSSNDKLMLEDFKKNGYSSTRSFITVKTFSSETILDRSDSQGKLTCRMYMEVRESKSTIGTRTAIVNATKHDDGQWWLSSRVEK